MTFSTEAHEPGHFLLEEEIASIENSLRFLQGIRMLTISKTKNAFWRYYKRNNVNNVNVRSVSAFNS
jgi:hypothetical protein